MGLIYFLLYIAKRYISKRNIAKLYIARKKNQLNMASTSTINDRKSSVVDSSEKEAELNAKLKDIATDFVDALAATVPNNPLKNDQKCPGFGMSVNTLFKSMVINDITFTATDLLRYTGYIIATLIMLLVFCPVQLLLLLLTLILIVLSFAHMTAVVWKRNANSKQSINPNKLDKLRKKYTTSKSQAL